MQKLILVLLQKGNKPFTLHIGGLFIVSLDCFATVEAHYAFTGIQRSTIETTNGKTPILSFQLTSSSLSYFTVMYSMQNKVN